MAAESKATLFEGRSRGDSPWLQSLRRLMRKKVGVACLIVIVVMYFSGALAPWVTAVWPGYGYNEQNLEIGEGRSTLKGCAACLPPSLEHPFGTDRLGRDLLTRIIFGLRTTVIITLASLVTGTLFLGIGMGLVAGYFGKMIDAVIMRVGEVFLAFPGIFLVLIIAATMRERVQDWVYSFEDATGIEGIVRLGVVDYVVVFGALAIFSWVGMARLVRGQVLSLKENQFIDAAQAAGASTWRILAVHVMPNILGPVIVLVSMGMGATAGSEIILSWLGIGIRPPTPSLGVMIFENGSTSVLRTTPHLLLFPVGTITVLIFAFNLLGDALNDAFNPRTR